MPLVVHSNQTCFVPGRFLLSSQSLTLDLFEFPVYALVARARLSGLTMPRFRIILDILRDEDSPKCPPVMYFLRPARRRVAPEMVAYLFPSAQTSPPFFAPVTTFHHEVGDVFPYCDIPGEEPSRLSEDLCTATGTPPQCSTSFPRRLCGVRQPT